MDISEPCVYNMFTTVSEDYVYHSTFFIKCDMLLCSTGKLLIDDWCSENLDSNNRYRCSYVSGDELRLNIRDIDVSMPNAVAFKMRWE